MATFIHSMALVTRSVDGAFFLQLANLVLLSTHSQSLQADGVEIVAFACRYFSKEDFVERYAKKTKDHPDGTDFAILLRRSAVPFLGIVKKYESYEGFKIATML